MHVTRMVGIGGAPGSRARHGLLLCMAAVWIGFVYAAALNPKLCPPCQQ